MIGLDVSCNQELRTRCLVAKASSISFIVSFVCIIVLSFGRCRRTDFFREYLAFGRCLLDVGNVAGVADKNGAPRLNGYYEATHFCDNILWVEILAGYWKLSARTPGRGDTTTLPSKATGNTWAWGGAEAASGTDRPSGVTGPIPNLLTQVQEYLANNTPRQKTLTCNMVRGRQPSCRRNSDTAAAAAVDAVHTAMIDLEAGARHLLIFNMPKMGVPRRKIGSGRCCRRWVFGFLMWP